MTDREATDYSDEDLRAAKEACEQIHGSRVKHNWTCSCGFLLRFRAEGRSEAEAREAKEEQAETKRMADDHHALGRWPDCPHCFKFYADDETAQAREAKLVEALRMLLGDLSDAERAVAAWQYGGGMGGNIASEDRGRFPSFASQGHRTLAEALITEPGE